MPPLRKALISPWRAQDLCWVRGTNYNHSTEQSISMHGAGNEPANVPLASEGNGVIKWIRKEHSGNCFSPLQRSWGTRGSASLH